MQEKNMWWKLGILLLSLVMVMSLMVACGDDDDDDDETTMPTTSEPTTAEPTQNAGPVKIGASLAITGGLAIAGAMANAAIKVVEKQVEERGGIQVGDVRRPMEVITFDDEGEVSGTVASWKKLVDGEGVSIMWGGAGGAQLTVGCEKAAEYEVPFIDYGGTPALLGDEYPWAARSGYNELATAEPMGRLMDDLQPETVALLGDEEEADHFFFDYLKENYFPQRGIEVVYEQYIQLGTQDMAPYITRIRSEDPDLLIHFTAAMGTASSTFREIMSQGGWGDITYLGARSPQSSFLDMPGAEGTYLFMVWTPVMDNPGTKEFLEAWEKYGSGPINPLHVYFYNAMWMIIHAIEFTGSDDPHDLIEALRSGNFSYESAFGPVTIGTDGENGYPGVLVKVGKDGEHTIAY